MHRHRILKKKSFKSFTICSNCGHYRNADYNGANEDYPYPHRDKVSCPYALAPDIYSHHCVCDDCKQAAINLGQVIDYGKLKKVKPSRRPTLVRK